MKPAVIITSGIRAGVTGTLDSSIPRVWPNTGNWYYVTVGSARLVLAGNEFQIIKRRRDDHGKDN